MQLCGSLSILWHCLYLGLERKLTFSSPVVTAEFSKFADILGAALSQHYLSGFEIAQLELQVTYSIFVQYFKSLSCPMVFFSGLLGLKGGESGGTALWEREPV